MRSPKLNYDEIRAYIENSHPQSVIMIGCDSVRRETNGKADAVYSTVVCIRKASGNADSVVYHGCKVFGGSTRLPDYGKVIKSGKLANLRMRMMQEVTFVLEAFKEIEDVIENRPWEIHLDINGRPDAESHVALQEARGYVMGVTGGRVPQFKPNALAASFAADHFAHGLLN